MSKPGLLVVGGGGHCKALLDVLLDLGAPQVAGLIEQPGHLGTALLGVPVIGCDDDLPRLAAAGHAFLVGIGQTPGALRRHQMFLKLQELGADFGRIVARDAYLSAFARIGAGTVLLHHACVNAGAEVGANGIVNTGALVEHDAKVGDHCHVSTGAIVNGGCTVGDGCFLGSQSVLSHGVTLAAGIVLGAGTVVVRDLLEPGTYVGNPARRLA